MVLIATAAITARNNIPKSTASPGLNEAFGELLAEVLCHRRVAVDRHKSGRRELVGDRLAKVAGPATAIENHGSILQRR